MSVVSQRQSVAWSGSMSTLKLLLDRVAGPGTVEIIELDKKFKVFDCVEVSVEGKIIIMEWQATPVNDMFADTVLTCIMQTEMGGTNIKGTASGAKPDKTHFKECLIETFQDTFGESSVPKIFKGDILTVTVAGKQAEINLNTLVRLEINVNIRVNLQFTYISGGCMRRRRHSPANGEYYGAETLPISCSSQLTTEFL